MTGDEVRNVAFREAFRGYKTRDVDRKLTEIADMLDAGSPTANALSDVQLRKAFRGYNMEDVDRLLDRLRAG